jgi:NAD(P)-dependent dehydrogenase (short-subunit alcohol dehydrogenase family)
MDPRPVVLVTGGARRLGRDIALDLARHGWDVALHYGRSQAEAARTVDELCTLGARARAFAADLGDEAACRALVPAVLAHFGRLQAVVNNAALFEYDDVHNFGHALMERHWRANVAAPVLLAQALHAHLQATDTRGCVVNLLDQKLWNPNPDYLSYTLSKAALESANTLLAQALAPRLRVCGVAPGVTLPSGPMDQGEFERAHRLTPLQRSSTAEDIARAVRFLLESPAITGTTLLVDGGQHLSHQARDVMFMTKD